MVFGTSIANTLSTGSAFGLVASGTPTPSPGRYVPDTIAYMQRFGHPYDMLFMHSWPEEIVEGLTNIWNVGPTPGMQVPLYAFWQTTEWRNYSVDFTIHSSNPFTANAANAGLESLGSPAALMTASSNAFGLIELLRVQLQISWCRRIMMPNNANAIALAKQQAQVIQAAKTAGDVLDALIDSLEGILDAASDMFTKIREDPAGFYGGATQPPVVVTQYGSFLRLYGVPQDLTITYQRPFTPILGYPHRAEIGMNFKRFFPPGVDIPTRAGRSTDIRGLK